MLGGENMMMCSPTQAISPVVIKQGVAIFTQSRIRLLQLCPKKQWFRYELGLVPTTERETTLSFGSLIHACLELWHAPDSFIPDERLSAIRHAINLAYSGRNEDEKQKELWHYATAMMRGYCEKYPAEGEKFNVVAVEKFAHGPIQNPRLRRGKSYKTIFALKADGLVEKHDDFMDNSTYWLLEHKTAASVDGGYLEKLWTDLQNISYSLYLEQSLGIKITGVIYNILVKTKLKQKMGETEEQFQVRYEEQCAKNKSGKSSATRQFPETDDEFQARLAEFYSQPHAFHREEILVDETRFDEVRQELWNVTQLYLHMRRQNCWPRNRAACWDYSRRCGYFDVCSAKDEDFEQMAEMYLRKETPHQEIKEFITMQEGTSHEAGPQNEEKSDRVPGVYSGQVGLDW
jgi:hypothetical protein